MSYQISLQQLRKAVSEFQVSKRNVEDIFNIKDALHRYFLEHAPLFDVVDGQLTVSPEMRLYIAWKDSKPSFHWCYKHDSVACEMMLRNEYTEYGDMSHRSVEDWLDILERHEVIQVTTASAVEDSIVKPLVNSPKRCLTLNEQEHKTTWSDAIASVTLDHYTGSITISYGECKTTVLIQKYNHKKTLGKLATMTVLKHLGKLIRNRLG